MKKIFVVPAEGKKVRNPERGGEFLSPFGAWVPADGYWLRREKAGDVIRSEPPKKDKKEG